MDDRAALEREFRARLDKVRAEIDRLEAKARSAKASADIDRAEALGVLKSRREAIELDLKRLQQAGDDAWLDMRHGVQAALNDIRTAVDRAASRFS
jgi:hypothetical protein